MKAVSRSDVIMFQFQDIRALLSEWSEQVSCCDRIFLRASGSAKQTFFATKAPLLDKRDSRLRMVPFPTRRPTFKELKRVWLELSNVTVYGKFVLVISHVFIAVLKLATSVP